MEFLRQVERYGMALMDRTYQGVEKEILKLFGWEAIGNGKVSLVFNSYRYYCQGWLMLMFLKGSKTACHTFISPMELFSILPCRS